MNTRQSPSGSAASAADLCLEAENWVRRRDAGLGADERQQLQAWLAADARHAAAFARVDRAGTELDWPLHAGTVDEILAGLAQRARHRAARRRMFAASGALAAVVIALALHLRQPAPAEQPARTSTLVISEPRRQTLPDGTIVELKAGAAISVAFSPTQRFVELKHGTAHFEVTTDAARPFVVSAGGLAVRAVGTAFCVELAAREVTVLVTEGSVSVNHSSMPAATGDAPAPPLALLDMGKSVVLPRDRPQEFATRDVRTLPPAELSQRLAWRIPRLEFSGTPLAEVIATINQHNRQRFVLADPALEKLVLSGILRADKVDALVDMLASDFQIQADRRGDEIVLRPPNRSR